MSGIVGGVGAKSGIVGSDIYPVGHVLQSKVVSISTGICAAGNVSSKTTVLSLAFTHTQTNPTIYVAVSGIGGMGAHLTNGGGVVDDQGHFEISNSVDGTMASGRMHVNQGYANTGRRMTGPFGMSAYSTVTANAGVALTYYFKVWAQSATYAMVYINSNGSLATPGNEGTTTMAIYELQE